MAQCRHSFYFFHSTFAKAAAHEKLRIRFRQYGADAVGIKIQDRSLQPAHQGLRLRNHQRTGTPSVGVGDAGLRPARSSGGAATPSEVDGAHDQIV